MARFVQLLVPLIGAVFAAADVGLPFFSIPGLQHLSQPNLNNRPTHPLDRNRHNFGHQSWLHRFMGQRQPSLSSGDVPYNRHHNEESYEDYNPFLNGGLEQFFGGSYGMNNFDPMSGIMFPGMSNALNTPGNGFNPNKIQPSGPVVKNPEIPHGVVSTEGITEVETPKEKPEDLPPSDEKETKQDKDPNPNEATSPSIQEKPEELPPKTNDMKINSTSEDLGVKKENETDLQKNKDYLMVGSDSNNNNLYLLHENNPNPTKVVIPNANQPINNVVYIPYYPGQNNNPASPVYQQPPSQVLPNKITVSGDNNGIASPAQPINTGNQNSGYVLVYVNGQLMQIPGVVVNSPQNNLPIPNSNPIQGTNYVIANSVPNNVPATQNPATNVIYATLPNQGSNAPIVIQMPQCNHGMSNNLCSSGAVIQNPIQGNTGNIMSSNGFVSTSVHQPNQNIYAQPAILVTSTGSNSYVHPTLTNQGVNAVVGIPNQGTMLTNQNLTPQIAVQLPLNTGSNQFNQPIVAFLQPTPGTMNNQNALLQPTVQIPANNSPNGPNSNIQPVISFQPNVATQSQGDHDQSSINSSPSLSGVSNGNDQLLAPTQGDRSNDATVNAPDHDQVTKPDIDVRTALPAPTLPNNNAIILDDNSMTSLGAQPAIMISVLKDTTDDKDEKNNSKEKKGKKDKNKKKNKKNKDPAESKEEKPLTNKKK